MLDSAWTLPTTRYPVAACLLRRAGFTVMSDEDEMRYAPFDSTAGLVQRGRGLGAIQAAMDPAAAAPHVYDAIRRDWRWDSVDDRSRYLARLIRDLELSPAPAIDLLAGTEQDCERATGVLELLALAGSDEARDALRSHIREGAHWILVLESVSDLWPPQWWEDLGEVARTRIGAEGEPPWRSEPWTRFGIEIQRPRPQPTRPNLTTWGEEKLLALLADTRADPSRKRDVLSELAHRPPLEGLIPLVPSLGTPDGGRALPQLRLAVQNLGVLALSAAHRWATDEREWLAGLGADVLADHLGPEVIPQLVAELADQWHDRTWCGPQRTAKQLARFGPAAAEAAPLLQRFWLRTPHSYERPAYLEALAAIAPAGLDRARAESLWDCEDQARLLGIAHTPNSPQALEQITALRDDPMEDPGVRAAAQERLTADLTSPADHT